MKFDELIAKIKSDDRGLAIRDELSDAVHQTIEALGYQVAADGTIVELVVREWQPPGGLVRPKRYPGRRRR